MVLQLIQENLIQSDLPFQVGLSANLVLDFTTFQEQWWGRQVSPLFYPYNPKTYYQQSWRSIFSQGVNNWQGFGETIKQQYKEKARNLIMTGFNFYLSEYLNANYPPW